MNTSVDESTLNQLGERIQMRLKQSREYFNEQRTRWDGLEEELTGELRSVTTRLDEWEEFHTGMQKRQIEYRKAKQRLEERRIELDARSTELDEVQLEIDSKRRQVEKDLKRRQEEFESGTRNEEQEAELQKLKEELDALRSQAEQTTNEQGDIKQRLAEQVEQHEKVQSQYQAARDALLASREASKDMQSKLAHAEKMLEKKSTQIDEMSSDFEGQEEEIQRRVDEAVAEASAAAAATAGDGPSDAQFEHLQKERDELINELSSLKREMIGAGNVSSLLNGDADNDGTHAQLQQAVEALEAAQAKNSELEAKVEGMAVSGGGGDSDAPRAITPGMSWEEQKAALLGQAVECTPLDKLTIDKAVKVTEDAVAQKDAEILELKRQLAESDSGGSVVAEPAPPAPAAQPAVAEDFDANSERAQIEALRAEMEEKMKKAEIEISLKRAEVARASRDLEKQNQNPLPEQTKPTRSLRDEMGL